MLETLRQPNLPKGEIFTSKEDSNVQSKKPIGEDITIGKKSLKKQRKGTRIEMYARSFLSSLALSSAVVSTMSIPRDTTPEEEMLRSLPRIFREFSLQDLEKRVETLYQIQIVSPRELPEIEINNEKFKTLEWTRGDIGRLMTDLDTLPPHFYFPIPSIFHVRLPPISSKPEDWSDVIWTEIEKQHYEQTRDILKKDLGEDFNISRADYDRTRGRGYFSHTLGFYPAEFMLVDPRELQESTRWKGWCLCSENGGQPNRQSKIPLDYRLFKDNDRLQEFITVAHEGIHRTTTPGDQEFVADLFRISVFEQEKMKELLKPNVEKAQERFGASVGLDLDYASKDSVEFLAVGGEFYLGGKDRFLEIYTEFIGQERAGQFYNYMRDNIFKGTEYKDYQKINR